MTAKRARAAQRWQDEAEAPEAWTLVRSDAGEVVRLRVGRAAWATWHEAAEDVLLLVPTRLRTCVRCLGDGCRECDWVGETTRFDFSRAVSKTVMLALERLGADSAAGLQWWREGTVEAAS